MRVAGVDIADGSWLVIWLEDSQIAGYEVLESLEGRLGEAAVVAIDVPLHLPEGRIGRAAEDDARRLLGSRSSTIFSSLPLALYEGGYTEDERLAARRRFGRSFSKQAWNIGWAVLDARRAQRSSWIETHPELAFAAMAGAPLPPKKSWDGVRRRLDALEAAGLRIPVLGARLRPDDVIDAVACAEVARRHARGEAAFVPATGSEPRIYF